MVYHEKVLDNYFIPHHRKYTGQHNQWDIHTGQTMGRLDVKPTAWFMQFTVLPVPPIAKQKLIQISMTTSLYETVAKISLYSYRYCTDQCSSKCTINTNKK